MWVSAVDRTSCEICISAHEGKDEERCRRCKPELDPRLFPYFTLYHYCSDQYIMGPNGPVSLNMLAIHQGMEDFNIDREERVDFSRMVRHIAGVILQARSDKAEQEAARKK